MTAISKVAAGLSLVSCITDIHKTAKIYSNKAYQKASSDAYISSSVGNQKANKISYKDAQRKNWLMKNNFFLGTKETFAKITGYLKGFGEGCVRYLPNLALSGIALGVKNATIANISAVCLAGLEAYDFIKNSTSLFQRTDYLE